MTTILVLALPDNTFIVERDPSDLMLGGSLQLNGGILHSLVECLLLGINV